MYFLEIYRKFFHFQDITELIPDVTELIPEITQLIRLITDHGINSRGQGSAVERLSATCPFKISPGPPAVFGCAAGLGSQERLPCARAPDNVGEGICF